MEIILLENIPQLGEFGDIVKVRPGYARNYLIPSGKAKYATEENRAEIEKRMAELQRHEEELLQTARERAEKLQGLPVSISVETHEDGRLFGSVSVNDITRAIAAAGGDAQRHELRLPDGPLRELGEHEVDVHLHADVDITVKVSVEASGVVTAELAEKSEMEEPRSDPDDNADASEQ